ncbi:MAG: hypothetical protein IJ437_06060 [Clostridia bacterium]|nr:hypothetical protein [Clostridia bacterium]
MKKVISLILCIVVLCCGLVACGGDSEIPDGMKRAKDDSKIYTFWVPEEWLEIETNSDAALVQVQTEGSLGNKAVLKAETVNAMAWPISDTILKDEKLSSEEKEDKAYESYVTDYKTQLTGAFTEVSELAEGVSVRDDARLYIFTAKHNRIYYKYYMNVIVANGYYFVVTFNFPQNNLEEDGNGGFKETESLDKAKFSDSDYLETMDEIVTLFETNG